MSWTVSSDFTDRTTGPGHSPRARPMSKEKHMPQILSRPARAVAALVLILSALALSSCAPEGGMYQGGSDSAPGWR